MLEFAANTLKKESLPLLSHDLIFFVHLDFVYEQMHWHNGKEH